MLRSTIGLDIGSSAVRAVEVRSTRRGPVLVRSGQVPLPREAVQDGEVDDTAAVTGALKALWSDQRFSTRRVVLGVASQRVLVRPVDLPSMSPADLRLALPFQVQDVLPMPVDQATMDFLPVEQRTSAGSTVVSGLLVAADTAAVMSRVDCVERAGLRPLRVDLTPFAVLRAVGSHLGPGSPEAGSGTAEAVVDVGARLTNVLVHTDGAPRFVRIQLGGGTDLTDELEREGFDPAAASALARTSDVRGGEPGTPPAAEAALARASTRLVEGIRTSLDYYAASAGQPLTAVVLSGGTALARGFPELLSESVGLPVRLGDPLLRLGAPRRWRRSPSVPVAAVAAVPVGLALGGAA